MAGRASVVVDILIGCAREDRDRAMGLVGALERAGRAESVNSERIHNARQSDSEVGLQPVRRGEGPTQ